jgi:uncharacterized protein (DUF58 family)
MDLKEIERAAAKIQQAIFKNSNSIAIGMWKSHFKGSGLTFKEHQVYSHGDDVRFIDWKLSAKTDRPFIKTFEEERNVNISVVLDLSPSMLIGHNKVSKLKASIELACLLNLMTQKSGDAVEIILVGEEVTVLPKSKGKEGIVQLLMALQKLNVLHENGNVNFNYNFKKSVTVKEKESIVIRELGRKKEVILISDFNDYIPISSLNKLLYRRNFHCVQLTSPLDENDSQPFSLFCRPLGDNTKKAIAHSKSRKQDEGNEKLGKRFKKINVKDRYLEEFIKEMI